MMQSINSVRKLAAKKLIQFLKILLRNIAHSKLFLKGTGVTKLHLPYVFSRGVASELKTSWKCKVMWKCNFF